MKRRLAAILASDVVGFSRLMGADEAGTLVRLQSLFRDVVRPAVRDNSGRIVKLMGDGLLAEFTSAVEAVECAATIQQAVSQREAQVPRERRLRLRIGLNLGDVIGHGDDIFGDGVNIAARLEQLAEPGSILLSGGAHDMVRDRVDLRFDDMGERALKNIAHPVRVFAARIEAAGGAAEKSVAAYSLAVLPFDNMSEDAGQTYFSDGISEDVITDLSRMPGLYVAARNSSFAYRGKAADIRDVARGLGVRYVLEGSVRRAGDRVRITAQLIDGDHGGHVWAERYDRELSDIFALQDEITANIVAALRKALRLASQDGAAPEVGDAPRIEGGEYDALLLARHYTYRFQRDLALKAIGMLENLIASRPTLAQAHADLSIAINTAIPSGWLDASHAPRAFAAAEEGVRLAPRSAMARRSLSLAYMWRKDLDRALEQIELSVALAPSLAEPVMTRGHILIYLDRLQEAADDLETALRMDPEGTPLQLHFLGHAYFLAGRFDEAAGMFERRIARQPQTDISRGMLVSAYGHLGRVADARAAWDALMRVNPDYSVTEKARLLPYRNPDHWKTILDGFARAGIDP